MEADATPWPLHSSHLWLTSGDNKMNKRKAFHAGENAVLIADEFAEEIYIGIAELDLEARPRRKRRRSNSDPEMRSSASRKIALFMLFAFSLGGMIAGIVLARMWR